MGFKDLIIAYLCSGGGLLVVYMSLLGFIFHCFPQSNGNTPSNFSVLYSTYLMNNQAFRQAFRKPCEFLFVYFYIYFPSKFVLFCFSLFQFGLLCLFVFVCFFPLYAKISEKFKLILWGLLKKLFLASFPFIQVREKGTGIWSHFSQKVNFKVLVLKCFVSELYDLFL